MGRIWKIGAKSVKIAPILPTTLICGIISLVPKRIGPKDAKQKQVFSQTCFGVSKCSPTQNEQLLICSTQCYIVPCGAFFIIKNLLRAGSTQEGNSLSHISYFFKYPDTLHSHFGLLCREPQSPPALSQGSAHMLLRRSRVPNHASPLLPPFSSSF